MKTLNFIALHRTQEMRQQPRQADKIEGEGSKTRASSTFMSEHERGPISVVAQADNLRVSVGDHSLPSDVSGVDLLRVYAHVEAAVSNPSTGNRDVGISLDTMWPTLRIGVYIKETSKAVNVHWGFTQPSSIRV